MTELDARGRGQRRTDRLLSGKSHGRAKAVALCLEVEEGGALHVFLENLGVGHCRGIRGEFEQATIGRQPRGPDTRRGDVRQHGRRLERDRVTHLVIRARIGLLEEQGDGRNRVVLVVLDDGEDGARPRVGLLRQRNLDRALGYRGKRSDRRVCLANQVIRRTQLKGGAVESGRKQVGVEVGVGLRGHCTDTSDDAFDLTNRRRRRVDLGVGGHIGR